MKKNSLFALLGLLVLLTVTSCHKDNPISNVTIQNDTNTDISVTLNNKSVTIPYGSSLTFSSSAGSAITGGVTTSGGSFGLNPGVALSWDLSSYTFPPSGTEVIPIDVSSDYFYVYAKNTSGLNVTRIDVNYGTAAQRTDFITIPSDGNIYGVGYYEAYSNSNLEFTLYDGSLVKFPSLNLPLTTNIYYNAYF